MFLGVHFSRESATLIASDIHFGRNRDEDVEAFIAAAQDGDQAVVLCGDFTQRAKAKEYERAAEMVGALIAAGNTVVITPGNHDFGIPGVPGSDHVAVVVPVKRDKARRRFQDHLMNAVLTQPALIAANGFDTITRHGDDLFVALRSTHRGQKSKAGLFGVNRIRKKQITWAAEQLAPLRADSALRFHLITHRGLWKDKMHQQIKRKRRLEEQLLVPLAFESFIHGHNHNFISTATETPRAGFPIRRLSVPTLSERSGKTRRAFVRWEPPGEPELILLGEPGGSTP